MDYFNVSRGPLKLLFLLAASAWVLGASARPAPAETRPASADHVVILGYERARVRKTGKLLECDIATVVGVENGRITKLVALADMSAIVEAYRVT